MHRIFIGLLCLGINIVAIGQRGKDGPFTVNAGTSIVNEFTALTANANAGATTLTVANSGLNNNSRFSGTLAPGDLVMIIQMQGATLNNANSTAFGQVTNYNNAGRYEVLEVASVPNGNTIQLCCALQNSYTSAGRVQVVRIPRYTTLTVNNNGTLTTGFWNGSVGGVLAVEVDGQTTFNGNGQMSATGRGFRGGVRENDNSPYNITLFRSTIADDGGHKGESIAGYQADYNAFGGPYTRGAPANGGGGGNAHNAGGGGGANGGNPVAWNGLGNPDNSVANYTTAWNLEGGGFSANTSSGGGRGGYAFSSSNQNALTVGPGNGAWGGDQRDNSGGLGGRPMDYSDGRIFLGGGGGAGDENNNAGGAGGNGGGIIYVLSYGDVNGTGSINSSGANGGSTVGGGNDGPGGGGGGGAVLVNATGTVTGISIVANGGNGGSQFIGGNEAEGPGGGGGGGYIAITNGNPIRTANGGTNGTTNSAALTEFPPNGATGGGAGENAASLSTYAVNTAPQTICAGQTATLNAALTGSFPAGSQLVWQDAATCGNVLGTGGSFTTPALFATTTYWVGPCPGTYRIPVTVTVDPVPVTAITGTVAPCIGTSYTYTAVAAAGNTYAWSITNGTITSGAGTASINVNWTAAGPGTLTLVQATAAGCDTTITLNVNVDPTPSPTITGPNTHCPLNATSVYTVTNTAGNSYAWTVTNGTITGGAGTNSISVNWGATGPGTVSVTETSPNGCVGTASLNVTFFPTPNPSISGPNALCAFTAGQIYSTTNQAGSSYTWTVTGGTITAGQGTNSITVNWGAAGAGTVSVTETTGPGCSQTQNYNVTINPLPGPSITGAATICLTHNGIVYSTANNAGNTYIWTVNGGTIASGQGTNSITVNWPTAGTTGASVSVTEITPAGCATTVNLPITVNALPAPNISGPNLVCEMATGQVYTTPNQAGSSYNWTVTGGTIVAGQGTNSITVDWGTAGPGTVSVTETTGPGCSLSQTFNVTIDSSPAPVISGSNNICLTHNGNVYTTPNNAGSTFSWSVTNGIIASGQGTNAITVNWPTTGAAGTVSVTESSATGCITTVTFAVTVNPLPAPSISGSNSVCELVTGQVYTTPGQAGATYNWTITGGTIMGGQGTNSVTVAWGTAGAGSLTVTETTGPGCSLSQTFNVTINPLPTPSITGANNICLTHSGNVYTTPNNAGSSYAWSVSNGTLVSGQGTNSITVDWPTTGSAGTVTVTETSSAGCVTTVNLAVTVNPLPIPGISGSDSLCENSTGIVYTTSGQPGSAFAWTITGGTIVAGQGSNSISVDWGAAGTGTLSVTETTGPGCSVTANFTVDIYPLPAPSISGVNVVCAQASGIAYSTPLNAGNSYSWSVSGGTIVSGQNSNAIVVDWGTAGAGTVTVTETTVFGCVTTVSLNVTINNLPAPVIAGANSVCEYTLGSGYSTPNTAGSSYVWTVIGGTISSGAGTAAITVDWGMSGAGSVTVTETNSNACVETTTLPVSILDNPEPAISGPVTVCSGDGGFVYQSPNTAGSTFNWSITGGAIMSGQNTNAITVTWGAAGTGQLSVTETNAVGCDTTVDFSITINPTPTTNVSGPIAICENTTASYTTPNVAGNTYAWTVTGGTIASGAGTNSITVDWGLAGNGTVTVTETHPLGCDSVFVLPVTIQPRPRPIISGPLDVCEFNGGYTYSTASAGPTYVWQVTGGNITSGQGSNSITVFWGANGTGTVELFETNAFGCDSSASVAVNIDPKPDPGITGPLTVCERTNNHVYSTNNTPGSSFNWGISGGWVVSGQGTNSITVNWGDNGTGTISVQEINAEGCDTTVQVQVTIEDRPNPVFTGAPIACEGSETLTYSVAPVATSNYNWTVTGGTIVSGQGTGSIAVNWTTPGNGQVTLVVTNAASCDSSFALDVQVNPLPSGVMIPDTARGCEPFTVGFEPALSQNTVDVQWDFGDNSFSNGLAVSHTFQNDGNYNVTATLISDEGCTATLEGFVEVYPAPEANFGIQAANSDGVLQMPFDSLFIINVSIGGSTFDWDFGDGNTGTGQHPVHIYTNPGTYTVTLVATNDLGCSDTTTEEIVVEAGLPMYIPTAFTPNGDNLNDVFEIVAFNIQDFNILIFDRWGKLLYESSDPNFQWDGTFDGNPVSEGVYTFVVDATSLDGTRERRAGTVTIYR